MGDTRWSPPSPALLRTSSSSWPEPSGTVARASPATRPAMSTCRPPVVLRDLPQRTGSSEDSRLRRTSGPGWNHNTLENDIALIELPSPLSFNDYIKPSCMPMAGDTADVGETVTCTGWGKPSDSAGGISPVLRMVEDRPIISNSECNAIYGIVGDGVVCIDTTGGKGTCNGDSGGPLNMKYNMKNAGDKWKQVGVVSFGASAGCEVGYPAGFTRTEYYLDWVCSETNGVGC